MPDSLKIPKDCTGCGACFSICSKSAILVEENKEGFIYPKVDTSKCIKCGLCNKICPIKRDYTNDDTCNVSNTFAVKLKDEEIRRKSSSGGLFYAICVEILRKDGIIFGASFNDDHSVVKHIGIERYEDIWKLMGSKYLQSDIGQSYQLTKKNLETGRVVFFSGTPCQIEGLYAYLKKDYPNLYTQDIVCHGVPSPKVWRLYKCEIEKKNNALAKKVSFRDKISGWTKYSLSFDFSDYTDHTVCTEDPYERAFVHSLFLRKCCYKCMFRNRARKADITLADCWGIETILPGFYDEFGVSAALIHSEKGQLLFESCKDIKKQKILLDDFIKFNPSYINDTPYNRNRDFFFKYLDHNETNISNWISFSDNRVTLIGRIVDKIYRQFENSD